jgi:hypothetical protein
MATQLDPLVSEFATVEEAESYDHWYREKVKRALNRRGGPLTDHEEVFVELHATIDSNEGAPD